MTDSQTRVRQALNHKEPDRIPLDIGGSRVSGVHLQAYKEYRKKLGLPESDPALQIRYLQLPVVEQDFRDLIGVDIESVDPNTAAEETPITRTENGQRYVDRWGCEYYMPDSAAYFDIRNNPLDFAETPADFDKYTWPREDSPAILDNIGPDAEAVWKKHGRAISLGRTCPGIYEMLHILGGYEKALTDLAADPDFCAALMDRILELKLTYYKAAIERLLAVGVEFFIISESDDLGTQNGLIMSPNTYRSLVKPRHTELFRSIKEFSGGRAFIELHSCGAVREIMPDLIESGVEILNPIQVSASGMDDTAALKRDFGDAIVFHGGGVDTQHTLAVGTPQQVRDEVKRRIEDLGPGGGFIFTPVHSIQHDVPFENFIAMIETFREYA